MAYRTRRSSGGRRRVSSRGSSSRRYSSPRRSYRSRSTGRNSRGGGGRAQTLRIVLQQPSAPSQYAGPMINPATGAIVQPAQALRKARFAG